MGGSDESRGGLRAQVTYQNGIAALPTSDAAQRAPTEDAAARIDQISRLAYKDRLVTILTRGAIMQHKLKDIPFNGPVGWTCKATGVANMSLKICEAVILVIAGAVEAILAESSVSHKFL